MQTVLLIPASLVHCQLGLSVGTLRATVDVQCFTVCPVGSFISHVPFLGFPGQNTGHTSVVRRMSMGGSTRRRIRLHMFYCGFHVSWRGGFSLLFSIALSFFALNLHDVHLVEDSTGTPDFDGAAIASTCTFA